MNLQPPNNNNGGHSNSSSNNSIPDLPNPKNGESLNSNQHQTFNEDIDSSCSTPYVSAPSSPGRSFNSNNGGGGCFFYSAPASPMHFAISSTKMTNSSSTSCDSSMSSFEFEFSARFVNNGSSATNGSMSSADELFLNGQIRPMKLSSHLQRPQMLAPLLDLENEEDEDHHQVEIVRGRDLRQRSKSLRRRTRSLSPLRNPSFKWQEDDQSDDEFDEIRHGCTSSSSTSKENNNNLGIEEEMEENKNEVLLCDDENRPSVSASSSRSSSVGRSSKRWVFLKEFLYRSKSEGTGRSNTVKFWTSMAFSPAKEKKPTSKSDIPNDSKAEKARNGSNSMDNLKAKLQKNATSKKTSSSGKPSNGIGKRRIPPSPHELHYTTNRAQAEEMRKKTYLPYKQGLLGCLGFSSKGYGAINGFARALNPVSSR